MGGECRGGRVLHSFVTFLKKGSMGRGVYGGTEEDIGWGYERVHPHSLWSKRRPRSHRCRFRVGKGFHSFHRPEEDPKVGLFIPVSPTTCQRRSKERYYGGRDPKRGQKGLFIHGVHYLHRRRTRLTGEGQGKTLSK